MRLLTACEKSNGDEANGKEKKQQAHCGRAGGSRTKVVQDHPSIPCSIRAADASGINPLCQEQSVVSGENLFLFLRPAYQTEFLWARAFRKRHRNLHPSPVPRVEASASPRVHVETMYGHTQCTDLKCEKKVIYPLVKDAQACQKDVSKDTNIKIQCIWNTTKCNAKLK